ncbi:MAG: cardiolipin synthase ClsB [Fluviibacter sp.]|jgi:cardiolipin synthase
MPLPNRLLQALHPRLQYLSGNRIALLCNGAEYFPALLNAINCAHESVRLETYIYANDAVGKACTEALCRAAARGVDVRLVVDGFGARNLDQHHRPQLEAAGVQIGIFRPEHQLLRHVIGFKRTRLRRMHRKVALIDGRRAFVGGINIIDDTTGNKGNVRFDFALDIEGPLIEPIAQAVDRQWLTLNRLSRMLHDTQPTPARTRLHIASIGHLEAALALRDNLMNRRVIEQSYLRAIRQAHDHISLAMAYFIPSRRILAELLAAAQRGVQVSLLLQGRVEYRLQHYASQALYDTLLKHGVRIFLYHPGFMHAKVAVIDDTWSTLGSANLDPFSLLVAREANIVIRNTVFAQTLLAQLRQAIHLHSKEITMDTWVTQPAHHRLLRNISAQLLYRVLRLTGYADNY